MLWLRVHGGGVRRVVQLAALVQVLAPLVQQAQTLALQEGCSTQLCLHLCCQGQVALALVQQALAVAAQGALRDSWAC